MSVDDYSYEKLSGKQNQTTVWYIIWFFVYEKAYFQLLTRKKGGRGVHKLFCKTFLLELVDKK